jgi:hypothetical protein
VNEQPAQKSPGSESQADSERNGVLRDSIKEHRGSYFVEYHPAGSHLIFATVSLVFLEKCPITVIQRSMEDEARHWLKRFPVPVMISSFDTTESLIYLSDEPNTSHLMGFTKPLTDEVVLRWGFLNEKELPLEQSTVEYLAIVYKNIPYRLQREVRKKVEREARATGRAIRLIVVLTLGIPVMIEVISLGVSWLGYLLSGIVIIAGVYKLAEAMCWLKPSKRKQEQEEKKLKMEHYYYHCELNPDAFNRLRSENFKREAIEQTRKEAEALRNKRA